MPFHGFRIVSFRLMMHRKKINVVQSSMDGSDLCFEIEKRAHAGFVYSEAVAR